VGARLVTVASLVRRYKSERSLPLGNALDRVQLCLHQAGEEQYLEEAIPDLKSITRALQIEVRVTGQMPEAAQFEDGIGVVVYPNEES
jgi:hypothetical protein